MLDASARKLIDPPLNRAGMALARVGFSANVVTIVGLAFGIASALMIAMGWFGLALVPLALGRVADGLDGAVARASGGGTDFGGYLDITADFGFYAAVPLAFIWVDPAVNGLAGAALLAAFYINGASFLGFAVLAAKQSMETSAQGVKSLYYSNGLLEGTETIVFFALLCLFPAAFPILAVVFAGLCLLTTVLRLWAARKVFSN
ncbi:CDP-alcohol phosphatidyltransferase family protein [Marivivens marinus]|uniref:CDP-alcohol phosphatidyltransferase family protein n=1 Tax=Marivivens marinus TaxID=3110173 RepID=UPI003B846702